MNAAILTVTKHYRIQRKQVNLNRWVKMRDDKTLQNARDWIACYKKLDAENPEPRRGRVFTYRILEKITITKIIN